MKTKHKNSTKSHTLLIISHYLLVRYESSCGHKIEEAIQKQTGNEYGRRKTKQTNKQGREYIEGNGRESSLQTTSLTGRD